MRNKQLRGAELMHEFAKRFAGAVAHELHAYDDYEANELFAQLVKTLRTNEQTAPLANELVRKYSIAYNDNILS